MRLLFHFYVPLAAVKVNTAVIEYAFLTHTEKELLTFYRLKAVRANGVYFNYRDFYRKYLSKVCSERTFVESVKKIHKLGWGRLRGTHLRLFSSNKLPKLKEGRNRWIDFTVLEKKFALRNVLIEDLVCRQIAMINSTNKIKMVVTKHYVQDGADLSEKNESIAASPSIPLSTLCKLINRKAPITSIRTFRKLSYKRKRRFRYTTEYGSHMKGRCEFIGDYRFERLSSIISPQRIFLDRRKRDSLQVGKERNFDIYTHDCYGN